MFTKTIVHRVEPDVEVSPNSSQASKKDGKSDSRGRKKADSKQEPEPVVVQEEPKPIVYQWKSITADGQVFVQNATSQEYERVDQLRLILETNPRTSEVRTDDDDHRTSRPVHFSSLQQVIHREDKVIIVFRADGSRIVSFADGTRYLVLHVGTGRTANVDSLCSITTFETPTEKSPHANDNDAGPETTDVIHSEKTPRVKIEALAYATVVFDCQTTHCRTVFANGSSIDAFANGTYSVYEHEGEKFDINENGDVLFDFHQYVAHFRE